MRGRRHAYRFQDWPPLKATFKDVLESNSERIPRTDQYTKAKATCLSPRNILWSMEEISHKAHHPPQSGAKALKKSKTGKQNSFNEKVGISNLVRSSVPLITL